MKINFVQLMRIYGLVPVNDWLAFAQRVFAKITLVWLISRLMSLLKTPLFFASLVLLLTYSPETVTWIFVKLGELELRVVTALMMAVMPDIFGAGGGAYNSWADLWANGLRALPSDMVDVMNGLGVAQLLGLVTTTIGSIMTIRILRSIIKKAVR